MQVLGLHEVPVQGAMPEARHALDARDVEGAVVVKAHAAWPREHARPDEKLMVVVVICSVIIGGEKTAGVSLIPPCKSTRSTYDFSLMSALLFLGCVDGESGYL